MADIYEFSSQPPIDGASNLEESSMPSEHRLNTSPIREQLPFHYINLGVGFDATTEEIESTYSSRVAKLDERMEQLLKGSENGIPAEEAGRERERIRLELKQLRESMYVLGNAQERSKYDENPTGYRMPLDFFLSERPTYIERSWLPVLLRPLKIAGLIVGGAALAGYYVYDQAFYHDPKAGYGISNDSPDNWLDDAVNIVRDTSLTRVEQERRLSEQFAHALKKLSAEQYTLETGRLRKLIWSQYESRGLVLDSSSTSDERRMVMRVFDRVAASLKPRPTIAEGPSLDTDIPAITPDKEQ